MTIHAYIGEKASRTHENRMFQEFLEGLAPRWAESEDWIYVVANALWGGAEIDLVCILPDMVVVADFKSHEGRLTGAENGRWRAGGSEVKGGNHANPFVQLRNNKFSVMSWLQDHALLPGQNLGHISAMVIFGGPVEDQLDLSGKVRTWFHVTDLGDSAKQLDMLASPSLRVSRAQAERIIAELGVTPHRWSGATIHDLSEAQPAGQSLATLTELQHRCLQQILDALKNPEVRSISVTGMTHTGKTLLMKHLAAALHAQDLPRRALYPNSRLASRVRDTQAGHLECDSIYRHLYFRDGRAMKDALPDQSKKSKAKHVPLLVNDDPDNIVYLVDDAHLLGNGYFQTVDGKLFGSGYLVNDFFRYADLGGTKRKVVFFGDPYQLPRMSTDESLLFGRYQGQHGLVHMTLELDQVYDAGDGGARLANAIRLVEAIRTDRYGSLELQEDEHFRIIDRKQAAEELEHEFRHAPFSVWALFFKNDQVRTFTEWIRRRLLGNASTDPVVEGELLEVFHSFRWESALETNALLYRGRRVQVGDLSPVAQVEQPLKGRQNPVTFSLVPRLTLAGPGLAPEDCQVDNLLVDYLAREDGILPADVVLAAQVWFQTERKRRYDHDISDAPPEESPEEAPEEAPEDAQTAIQGVSLMHYGYAATVHHAQGMRQPWCYVDGSHQARSQSASYFRWLYTALTVAGTGVVLFNFRPVHAFSGMVWKANAAKATSAIKVGYGWSLQQRPLTAAEENLDCPAGLVDSPNPALSAAAWLKIAALAKPLGWTVVSISSSRYLEKLTLEGVDGQVVLSISYDGAMRVTSMRLSDTGYWPLLAQLAQGCVHDEEATPGALELRTALKERLGQRGWHLVSARESSWRLQVVAARQADELIELYINFDKAGRASTVSVLNHSPGLDPELLKEVLE